MSYANIAVFAVCFIIGLVVGGTVIVSIMHEADNKPQRRRRRAARRSREEYEDDPDEAVVEPYHVNPKGPLKNRLINKSNSKTRIDCDGDGENPSLYVKGIRKNQNRSYKYSQDAADRKDGES